MFYSKELNEIIENQESSNKEMLNKISEDIKTLQEYLKQNVCVDFESRFIDLDQQTQFTLSFTNSFIYYSDTSCARRLIETKCHIRIKCYKYLPKFLQTGLSCITI